MHSTTLNASSIIALFALVAACDGDECADPCAATLSLSVDDLTDATSPLDVMACDGDFCAALRVHRDECVLQEQTTNEPPFNVCFYGELQQLLLGRQLLQDDPYVAPANPEISLVVTDAEGVIWLDERALPTETRDDRCQLPCFTRSVDF